LIQRFFVAAPADENADAKRQLSKALVHRMIKGRGA
jgi:hypothetical protein